MRWYEACLLWLVVFASHGLAVRRMVSLSPRGALALLRCSHGVEMSPSKGCQLLNAAMTACGCGIHTHFQGLEWFGPRGHSLGPGIGHGLLPGSLSHSSGSTVAQHVELCGCLRLDLGCRSWLWCHVFLPHGVAMCSTLQNGSMHGSRHVCTSLGLVCPSNNLKQARCWAGHPHWALPLLLHAEGAGSKGNIMHLIACADMSQQESWL